MDGFWAILGFLCGHFWVTSCSSGPIWVYGVYFGIILIRLQKAHIYPTNSKNFMQPYSQFGAGLGALVGNFGLTLSIWGWLWVTLGPLFCHFGRSEQPTLFNLQKTHIFTMNFNDFTPLGVRTSGRFLGHSGLTLRPLLGNFAQLGANLNIWSFGPFTKNTYFAAKF